MYSAAADEGELLADGRRCLATMIVSPADRRPILVKNADMAEATADRTHALGADGLVGGYIGRRRGRFVMEPPAYRGAVVPETAAGTCAQAYGGEQFIGGSQSGMGVAPAYCFPVLVQATGMTQANADGGKSLAIRGRSLSVVSSPQQWALPSSCREQVCFDELLMAANRTPAEATPGLCRPGPSIRGYHRTARRMCARPRC